MSHRGRSTSEREGHGHPRQEALDRVDGLLRTLAKDEMLQDDLRHPDVQKALEHWTGYKRLTEEEANDLMDDNYRIQSVCDKMAELQACCKQAGMGLPLSRVLAGRALYDDANEKSARAKGDHGSDSEARRRPYAPSSRDMRAPGGASTTTATASGPHDQRDSSWRQAFLDELFRVAIVCACALVFTLALRHFRGDNPFGQMGGRSGDKDEL